MTALHFVTAFVSSVESLALRRVWTFHVPILKSWSFKRLPWQLTFGRIQFEFRVLIFIEIIYDVIGFKHNAKFYLVSEVGIRNRCTLSLAISRC